MTRKPVALTTEVINQRIQETERELTFIVGKADALSALLVAYRRILELDAAEAAHNAPSVPTEARRRDEMTYQVHLQVARRLYCRDFGKGNESAIIGSILAHLEQQAQRQAIEDDLRREPLRHGELKSMAEMQAQTQYDLSNLMESELEQPTEAAPKRLPDWVAEAEELYGPSSEQVVDLAYRVKYGTTPAEAAPERAMCDCEKCQGPRARQRPELGAYARGPTVSAQDVGAGARWGKRFDPEIGLFDLVALDAGNEEMNDRFIACGLFEADANTIIALHDQAQAAQRRIEALEAKANVADKLAESLIQRGQDVHRGNPQLTEDSALASALSGGEWEWLMAYRAALAAANADAEAGWALAAELGAPKDPTADEALLYWVGAMVSDETYQKLREARWAWVERFEAGHAAHARRVASAGEAVE